MREDGRESIGRLKAEPNVRCMREDGRELIG